MSYIRYTVHQDKLQMDQKFKDEGETIYLLKQNIGIILYNLRVGKIFLILVPFSEAVGKKIDTFDYRNIKKFAWQTKLKLKNNCH